MGKSYRNSNSRVVIAEQRAQRGVKAYKRSSRKIVRAALRRAA